MSLLKSGGHHGRESATVPLFNVFSRRSGPHRKILLTWEKNSFLIVRVKSQRRKKNDKKAKMKGGLGWIRGLRGQEQDMSSLALEWEPFF